MSNVLDQFDRANGAVGNGWSTWYGTMSIENEELKAATDGAIYRGGVQSSGDYSVRAAFRTTNGSFPYAGFWLRMTGTNNQWTNLGVSHPETGWMRVAVWQYTGGAGAVVASKDIPWSEADNYELKATLVGNNCYVYIDGAWVFTARVSAYLTSKTTAIQCSSSLTRCSWVAIDDDQPISIAIDPDEVATPGAAVDLYVTAQNTAWTPGTPGSPTFTAERGTITAQVVTSATTAHLVYQPPTLADWDTIRDSTTGLQVPLVLGTSLLALSGGEAAGMVAEQVAAVQLDVLGLQEYLGYQPGETRLGIFTQWYDWLFGNGGTEVGVGTDLAEVVRQFTESNADPETLRYVIELIRQIVAANAVRLDTMTGYGAYDLADVAITVQGAGSKTIGDLSDAISGVRGLDNVDLTGVFGSLYNLRTANGYTLADVSNWISNLSEPDLSAVTDAIANLDGDVAAVKAVVDAIGGYDDAAVLAAIAALVLALAATEAATIGAVGTVGTAVAAGAVENTAGWVAAAAGFLDVLAAIAAVANTLSNLTVDVQPVLDAVDALATEVDTRFDLLDTQLSDISLQISALGSRLESRLPMIYPGSAGVTWGTPVELDALGIVFGPMDGVRVELTSVPNDIGRQVVPGHDRYMYLGSIVFSQIDGDLDERQQINWDQAIYVPKATSQVDNLVVRCRPGVHLTVTPWVLAVV